MKFTARVEFYFQKMARKVKVAENKAIYRVAGLIRTATKRSMRMRKGSSKPGRPPHAHQPSSAGLRAIAFAVDYNKTRAIIGPIKIRRSNFFDAPATHIQEFGGVFRTLRAVAFYPKRSYMKYTLDKLIAKGLINKEFSVGMAKVIGY
jgi:hypothetical protein